VAAAAVLAITTSLALALVITALAADRLGSPPSLISSTGIVAEWSNLRQAAAIVTGVSGSVLSAMLAVGGWLVVRRERGQPGPAALVGWFFFSFNAWLVAAWMIASPVLGVGGWMTIVDRFANRGPLRASIVAAGLFLVALAWKESAPSLAWTTGNGKKHVRNERARVLTRTAWISAAVVVLGAAAWSPISSLRSIQVAAGILAATVPMMLAAKRVGEHPVRGEPLVVARSPVLLGLALAAAVLFIVVLGRGVSLS
jgi:hypothetical protein